MTETVEEIISKEHKRMDAIANLWIKGFINEANNEMYQLFIDYGYTYDCEDTEALFGFINDLINNTLDGEPEIWQQVMSYPEYEVTIDGSVRRTKNKHLIKVQPNDRVKLTKDGKVVTVKIWDLVYENWYKNKEENKEYMKDEYVNMSSDIEKDEDALHMSGYLEMCGTTETRV